MVSNENYLNRVKIFLEQELPDYKGTLSVANGVMVFIVPPGHEFPHYYERLQTSVTACIARIRNLETDLEFTVRSAMQERDFKVYKSVTT